MDWDEESDIYTEPWVQTSLRLPEWMDTVLRFRAADEKCTKAHLIRNAIERVYFDAETTSEDGELLREETPTRS